jgi:ABC-type bacteriocin/lantibiotic exporter with double-glycine peptidase domain
MRSSRLFIPEIVQTTAIDCGPASLTALLAGFNIHTSYGRLREACQTGVDGTCIDSIEDLANRLGLEAEQIVLPADHISINDAKALPAIAIVQLPNGLTHFVVIWRCHGSRFQVMDPATGRRWIDIDEFSKELYSHEMVVDAETWRTWAESSEFVLPLRARMVALGAKAEDASAIISAALDDPTWRSIATTDAAVRMLQALSESGAFTQDPPSSRLFRKLAIQLTNQNRPPLQRTAAFRSILALVNRSLESQKDGVKVIPNEYWSARPTEDAGQLMIRGAVLVRVKACAPEKIDLQSLPPEVAIAASEERQDPIKKLWRLMKQDGLLIPSMIGAALVVSSVGVMLQALLFRALVQGGPELVAQGQRLGALIAIVLLLGLLLLIDVPSLAGMVGLGRRIEMRFRMAFLKKLPRISEQYFHSRPASDMAERAHSVQNLRVLPLLAGQILRSVSELIFTTLGVIWIDPHLWFLALASGAVAVGLPLAAQPLLQEREMRARTHGASLSRFYFDALLGLVPIRTHVADSVIRDEHNNLLSKWADAGLEAGKIAIGIETLQMFAGFGLAALLIVVHAWRYPESSAVLLLAYWAVNIPLIGQELANLASAYPQQHNTALRVLEPLSAIETAAEHHAENAYASAGTSKTGTSLEFDNVSVSVSGHGVLRNITTSISAGEHVAIVGPSGAGKSTFVGLLLGWRQTTGGVLHVDGEPLDDNNLSRLRKRTAWIDPSIHLWNRSLIENLRYGSDGDLAMQLGDALDQIGLTSLLENLPDGLRTVVGDSGSLVSGGEGERVRIGRAMLRSNVRLAILDEPFRGLDAGMRRRLLAVTRERWADATVLFASHDIEDTLSFGRVIVLEHGTIVEDGKPRVLAGDADSRYGQLLQAEMELKRRLLDGATWRQLRMQDGILSETKRVEILSREQTGTPRHSELRVRREMAS